MEDSRSAETIKVQIFLSCRKLKDVETFSNSDPFIEVFEKRSSGQWVKLGQTEVIWDNLNPDFIKSFTLNYYFEEQTFLLFQVFDANIENGKEVKGLQLGETQCTLGEIAGARGQKIIKTLTLPEEKRSKGNLIIRMEEVSSENSDEVSVEFKAKGLTDGSCWYMFHSFSPFFYLSRSMEDGTSQRVYCSEQGQGVEPGWLPVTRPVVEICNGDLERSILFELYDHYVTGRHTFIGSFKFTLKDIVEMKKKAFDLIDISGKKKAGEIFVESAMITKLYSFLEYIAGGCQISLMIAVDFTGSNGHPQSNSSLHFVNGNGYNHYQAALHAVSEILLYYDSDKKVPMYGFGGKVNKRVNHCFPLSFNEENPEVQGLSGIMEAYRSALSKVELSGPTLFTQVIRTAVLQSESSSIDQSNQQYFILLILTDGEIHDMKETIDWIVRGSKSPLSIVIVGIGNENFDNMEQLDADEKPLINSRGERMMRDIVQFVPFRNFGYSPIALTKEVLAEVPREITNYFRIKGIVPNEPVTAPDFESLKNYYGSDGSVIDAGFNDSAVDYTAYPFNQLGVKEKVYFK
jgi:hypothetical protein